MLDTLRVVPSKKPFVHLVLDPKLLERIEDYRFAFRMQTRSDAIRALIEAGLEAEFTGSTRVDKPGPKNPAD